MNSSPKICYTAAGILIHQDKVLLVKHKKLGIWLNPGGHIEANELPHQAAEREFLEETGIKVHAVSSVERSTDRLLPHGDDSEYVPTPILMNVHWVCPENYDRRARDGENYERVPAWKKGCEQHLGFVYLLTAVGSLEYTEDTSETDGIGWFTRMDLDALETKENIRVEVRRAFLEMEKVGSNTNHV